MAKTTQATQRGIQPLPPWLHQPPTTAVNPPVQSRPQTLPLKELRWDDFERLCLALVKFEAEVEHCQRYGTPGQAQGGIDLYARFKDTKAYGVFQCKQTARFGPAAIKKAVSLFENGPWSDDATSFTLCLSVDGTTTTFADEYEAQVQKLKSKGVEFPLWDVNEISGKLKNHPNLVDDFFGREWVRIFVGDEAAQSLGDRLDGRDVFDYRTEMKLFYGLIFNQHDPGIPINLETGVSPTRLTERYVIPEIIGRETDTGVRHPSRPESPAVVPENSWRYFAPESGRFEDFRTPSELGWPVPLLEQFRTRELIDNWMARSDRSVVVGVPGGGKSSLLRFVMLDLLSDSPTLSNVTRRWGDRVPVWLPFAFWTKLIASGDTEGSSILGCVRLWLRQWNQERLSPLVERAIKDERLLLFVDGLDEAVDESSGSIALQKLQVYVQQNNVAVLVTSRPNGIQQLPIYGEGWQIADLAPLSHKQQDELCNKWFKIFADRNGVPAESILDTDTWASSETGRFLEEMSEVPELSDLAEIPLLLSLLLYLRLQGGSLPRGRFEAYNHLIDHLIEEHPARRRTAGLITENPGMLTAKEVRRILERVAYVAHLDIPEGGINTTDLESIVVETLVATDSMGFGFTQVEAGRIAPDFLDIVEGNLGLLVPSGSHQVSFFHRSIQEFLAAEHLSRMDLLLQEQIVEDHGSDSRWREVILGLFWNTRRSEDIDRLADRDVSGATNRLGYEWAEIRAEVAFGSFECTIGLARRIASETFQRIEHDPWMPHRIRLLAIVMLGVREPRMRELVEQRIKLWLNCRGPWRASHYGALSRWPASDETIKVLVDALDDDDEQVRLEAAQSVSQIANSHDDLGDELIQTARSSLNPATRIAALEALRGGWLDHHGLDAIAKWGRDSSSPELRIESCAIRVDKGIHDEKDLEKLLGLGNRESDLRFGIWSRTIAKTLVKGWPGFNELKHLCLNSLKDPHNPDSIDRDVATEVLLDAFPQDNDIARYFAEKIKTEEYPFLGFRHFEAWKSLATNFKNNPDLIAAIDEWAPLQKFHDPEVSYAALLGKTPRMKGILLARLADDSTSIPHWSANALLEGWGMEDAEVEQALKKLAYGAPSQASSIAYLIPRIIPVKEDSRKLLMQLLESRGYRRNDMIIQGLSSISENKDDADVVEVVLKSLKSEEESSVLDDPRSALIMGFPRNPLVRELSIENLKSRLPLVDTIAYAYFDDSDMRSRIMEFLTPLPVPLRRIILKGLTEDNRGGEFAHLLLGNDDADPDAELKVYGSIGYHSGISPDETIVAPVVEQLQIRTRVQGFDYHERRLAALAGLIVLGRLDIISEIPPDSFSLGWVKSNVSVLRLVCEKWNELWDHFGSDLPDVFVERGVVSLFWSLLCQVAKEFPDTHDSILEALEVEENQDPNYVADSAYLNFVAAIRPSSPILLALCLKALGKGSSTMGDLRRIVVAAEILAEHFRNQPEIVDQLPGRDNPHLWSDGLIAALCLGWPKDPVIDALHEEVMNLNRQELSPVSYFALMYAKVPSNEIVKQLERDLSDDRVVLRLGLSIAPSLVVHRVRRDSNSKEALEKSLYSGISASCKINFPKILALADGVSPNLADWCRAEIDAQLSEDAIPELGFDIFSGRVRSVVHSLLDVVGSSS